MLEPEQKIEILLKEYETLWSYYMYAHKSRMAIFTWMLKIVMIPASVLALLLAGMKIAGVAVSSQDLVNIYSIALPPSVAMLICIYLVGVSFFAYYASETDNSHIYISAANAVRGVLRDMDSDVKAGLVLDELVNQKMTLYRANNYVAAMRGLAFALLNGLVLSVVYCFIGVCLGVGSGSGYLLLVASGSLCSIAIHYAIWRGVVKTARQGERT